MMRLCLFVDDGNRPVIDRQQIARTYAKSWLIIDVISIVPFDDIVTNKSLGFFKLFKAIGFADSGDQKVLHG